MASEAADMTDYGAWTGPIARSVADGDTVVLALRGEHDLATVDAVSDAIARAIDSGARDLVVDLSDVEFMDASTVGVLLRSRYLLHERGRSLVVRAPSVPAAHVLRICGIAHLFDPAAPRPTPRSTSP